MLKKVLCILIIIFSTYFINVSNVISEETTQKSNTIHIQHAYIDFFNRMLMLKSMGIQYFPYFYPDTLYVGPHYEQFNRHNTLNQNEEGNESILIDLKWQLNEDWLWGVYSKIGHKDEGHENDGYLQTGNPLDTDIGIVFIHKF
jgi:hypothetical protein